MSDFVYHDDSKVWLTVLGARDGEAAQDPVPRAAGGGGEVRVLRG